MSSPAEKEEVKPSRVYLAAWMAAEKALPKTALELIERHDALYARWRTDGWKSPIPQELRDASAAVEKDPLASIAFSLRKKTNDEACKEWSAEQEKKGSLPQIVAAEREAA